ncbi:MAG: polymer-forming cytoskeletal protein [Pseudomonadota bacterium]
MDSSDEQAALEQTARQRVLDAISRREVADFSSLPDGARRLSAEFLQGLISGTDDASGNLCCALRIRGAKIKGPLRPPASGGNTPRVPLQFWDCHFDSVVDLSGADLLVLRIVDSTLPAFIGASLQVSADLDLSGSEFTGVCDFHSELTHVSDGCIHLANARIGGNLVLASTKNARFTARATVRLDGTRVDGELQLAGAQLEGDGKPAISARSVVIGGNVDLTPGGGHRFEAHGEVIFAAAQIVGDLRCSGARLLNPGGRALHCEDLKVESVALSADAQGHPFESRGRLNFLTAVIGGSFFMNHARLSPGPDFSGLLSRGGPVALNLQQARISNAIGISNVGALDDDGDAAKTGGSLKPVRGWFLLTGIEINALFDEVDTAWPEYGFLDLGGASYARLSHVGGGNVIDKRIGWLRRQYPGGKPDAARFRPQPYEQLSRVLRESGLTREANAVAVEKIRMRLAAKVDAPLARLLPRLLMLVSHYGYSSGRAIVSFLMFVLFGAAMYTAALFLFQQPFVPVESEAEPVTYTLAFNLAEQTLEQGCPGLSMLHYALDSALPVIDLGQDQRCRFTPTGPARWLWLLLHSLYVIAGAALSAVVVLTLTGVLRED